MKFTASCAALAALPTVAFLPRRKRLWQNSKGQRNFRMYGFSVVEHRMSSNFYAGLCLFKIFKKRKKNTHIKELNYAHVIKNSENGDFHHKHCAVNGYHTFRKQYGLNFYRSALSYTFALVKRTIKTLICVENT